jgi:hypothetical protein
MRAFGDERRIFRRRLIEVPLGAVLRRRSVHDVAPGIVGFADARTSARSLAFFAAMADLEGGQWLPFLSM